MLTMKTLGVQQKPQFTIILQLNLHMLEALGQALFQIQTK